MPPSKMPPNRSPDNKALLTIADVAQRLRVSTKTIRRLIGSGELPAFKVGRLWRVSERDLQRFLHDRWRG